ncbi:hypothetical protein GRZ55_22490 [Chelativorans sp. ZYF759]|uniref:hypothetical protein n=1 Tax=Chelativorans sp. ZYF759 TaxID=2692213 RepID=UPI00145D5B50|nr:hypothetical protein [Chelativorans sp. ZYF759]NMG42001.1 hypothetical protein [Chelativorans sp. ZYF759]
MTDGPSAMQTSLTKAELFEEFLKSVFRQTDSEGNLISEYEVRDLFLTEYNALDINYDLEAKGMDPCELLENMSLDLRDALADVDFARRAWEGFQRSRRFRVPLPTLPVAIDPAGWEAFERDCDNPRFRSAGAHALCMKGKTTATQEDRSVDPVNEADHMRRLLD